MKPRLIQLAVLAAALFPAGAARAVDHNNVDAHRPLTFDDFRIGTEMFGTRIQPLMKCRAAVLAAA